MSAPPDPEHQRPADTDDATVFAAGKVSEAFEWVERARGRLFDFHQMIGHADRFFGDAADALDAAGHHELAEDLRTRVVGRNVVRGKWTFELVEDFDDTYWSVARQCLDQVRMDLLDGRRHVHEAQMKVNRRRDGPTDDV